MGTQKQTKIVIADDDAVTRSALRMLLTEQQHQVVGEASDGERAVDVCLSTKPDIMFVDINMPRMNGHQVAEQVRQLLPNVMIIMISSLPTVANVQQAMQAGAGGFVVKPFNGIKVLEAINNCLKRRA